ncbi:histidinol dehydrogenase [Arenimonas sp.]|uniref:histidinol dehydrogenase n=1 Tax=Arenimonas sp. TaxID=1872635 RepID=UPI0039E66892
MSNRIKARVIDWTALDAAQRAAVLNRPAQDNAAELLQTTQGIINEVRRGGDAALRAMTEKFDGAVLHNLQVSEAEFAAAEQALTATQLTALKRAIGNVQRFHEAQLSEPLRVETSPGVVCERHYRAIDAVGLYAPAGTAPLPSTVIMLAVPASIANCPTRVLCTPPRRDGSADPAVLVTARLCGIDKVFKIGGAQAVAAMAYGTESVPKTDKIYGPGNRWVTAAKMLVANDAQGAALDLPAGPSEVLVLADDRANAAFVAADLLAQAEHSADAQAILVTTSAALIERVQAELDRQTSQLSRENTLLKALEHARLILVKDLHTAFEVSNLYAPEHLIVQVDNARQWLPQIRNAGSVFLGPWTPETMGDYCSGTNHVLPTYGFARAYSGLSLVDFMKRMTVQELSSAGLEDLGPTAVTIAELEGLDAHANAVKLRMATLKQGAA